MVPLTEDRSLAAREFYCERLGDSFARSHSLAGGLTPEDVTTTPSFAAVLAECCPGSLDAARRIGEMAVVHMSRVATGPWWSDLLNYERAHFLQAATNTEAPPTNRPRRGVSALCMNFAWAIPQLLEHLKSGMSVTEDLRRTTTLLFSRGVEGKVHVVEVGPAVEKVFRATNGLRTQDQIAEAAGLLPAEADKMLKALAKIGAVCEAKSAKEMLESLRVREQA